MRKHLVTAVSARQVELPRRPCEDRMEIPSDCQDAQQQPSARPGSAPAYGESPHCHAVGVDAVELPGECHRGPPIGLLPPWENQPRGCPSLLPQWR